MLTYADVWWQRFHWGYIVLDEAHRIKNEKTLMGQAVRSLTYADVC